MNFYKTIGIIGGMGPESTADLYMKIVKYYQTNFGAKYDRDFPPFIIYSLPIPEIVETIENEKLIFKMLSKAAKILEKDGCEFIVIACNSIQFLLNQLRNTVKIPVLGIAATIAKYVQSKDYKRVGILATETTLKKGVYDKNLRNLGITLIKPNKADQKLITQAIMNQLAGKTTTKDKNSLIRIINNLVSKGAETILLACTELPLIINQSDIKTRLVDCTEIYAKEAGRIASQNTKIAS